ncbi:Inner membrane lipoprotein YiaD precursor [Sebaldella termitidis]|jgi:outer membrane protein OmpA-like peptidoglycan-associated protein|uniref:OmpA/MotB domain protein n=1 Tax=Sebaldella termitidis (strain ATCC 33386 / NCTC 11300) TaxID=526218 RepID=D1AMP0_SEBTE|nr:OmpA family protein [Sebaldella termitidis]ACZ09614.1 OmpA/MotB domain protein [Sebaldella termitidis ATCC 33386]SUI24944.1 Inner membrane lipoprotein YiaD precursor [Sebaldella termitidis]
MKNKFIMTLALSLIVVSCTTTNPETGKTQASKTTIGAGAGAAAGAVLGQIIGKDTKGTVIGTAAGAAVGAVIGNVFDKQEAKLREDLKGTGVEVTRTAEGEIKLVAPENVTFATNSSTISSRFTNTLDSIASVLKEYPDSNITVSGHTDSTGNDAINNPLSVNRANSVANYLKQEGIASSRITAVGYGSKQPVASNSTSDGRAQNRRVEIKITAK